jgi:hypothetical protein
MFFHCSDWLRSAGVVRCRTCRAIRIFYGIPVGLSRTCLLEPKASRLKLSAKVKTALVLVTHDPDVARLTERTIRLLNGVMM